VCLVFQSLAVSGSSQNYIWALNNYCTHESVVGRAISLKCVQWLWGSGSLGVSTEKKYIYMFVSAWQHIHTFLPTPWNQKYVSYVCICTWSSLRTAGFTEIWGNKYKLIKFGTSTYSVWILRTMSNLHFYFRDEVSPRIFISYNYLSILSVLIHDVILDTCRRVPYTQYTVRSHLLQWWAGHVPIFRVVRVSAFLSREFSD
jgi:hypothetical protein